MEMLGVLITCSVWVCISDQQAHVTHTWPSPGLSRLTLAKSVDRRPAEAQDRAPGLAPVAVTPPHTSQSTGRVGVALAMSPWKGQTDHCTALRRSLPRTSFPRKLRPTN